MKIDWPLESQSLRASLHEDISRNFVESWNNGIDADMPTFLSQFSATVDWYDHAFFIRHKGPEGLAAFRTSWLKAIKDFRSDIRSIHTIEGGTVVQCIYHGTMIGPLPGRKASGKSFAANVLIVLGINEEDKIQKVDEYYSATLDEAGDVDTYRLMNPRPPHPAKL